MYKCDLCHDRLRKDQVPACVEACEKRLGNRTPLRFGDRDKIGKMAHERAKEIDGFIYGEKENGGTGTLYVSKVPFEKIGSRLAAAKSSLSWGRWKIPFVRPTGGPRDSSSVRLWGPWVRSDLPFMTGNRPPGLRRTFDPGSIRRTPSSRTQRIAKKRRRASNGGENYQGKVCRTSPWSDRTPGALASCRFGICIDLQRIRRTSHV